VYKGNNASVVPSRDEIITESLDRLKIELFNANKKIASLET
jgi:hypothetical protein